MSGLTIKDLLNEHQFIVVNAAGKLELRNDVRLSDTEIMQTFHWHFGTVNATDAAAMLDEMTPSRVLVVAEHGYVKFKPRSGSGIIADAVEAAMRKMVNGSAGNLSFVNSLRTDDDPETMTPRLWAGDLILAHRFVRALEADFEEYFRAALSERRGISANKYEVPTHDTTESLLKYMQKRRKEITSRDDVIPTMPVSKHGKKSSRTWGIEVESGGARGVSKPNGWTRKGDGSLTSAYGESARYIDPLDCDYNDHREECDIENYYYKGDTYPDGTIATEDGYRTFWGENPAYCDPDDCEDCGNVYDYDDYDDDDCAEFVSPILHSFHSQGLEKLTKRLSQEPQNDSAGVHVHVEARDLTPRQIGALVFAYQMIEPLIEASYRRDTRVYCKRRPDDEFVSIIRNAKTAKALSYSQRVGNEPYIEPGDRYVSLNLCSLGAHGTVEFRAMGPVYEYDHLIKWAFFCREMVNCAKNNAPGKLWNKVRTFEDVKTIFQAYGSEYNSIVMDEAIEELTESALESLEV
jgi:hypothetical protein